MVLPVVFDVGIFAFVLIELDDRVNFPECTLWFTLLTVSYEQRKAEEFQ